MKVIDVRNIMDADDRVQRIIDDFIELRNRSETVSESELIAAHPDLAEALRDELRKINLLAGAFQDQVSGPSSEKNEETIERSGVGSNLMIRCPHCSESKSVASDTPWTEITCDSCGKGFSLVVDTDHFAISEVGHFSMIRRLGMGSFGTVWQAYDTILDRIVAVKIPRHSLVGAEAEQFFREARAAAQLKHPNIVAVHEIGHSEGKSFIVSDFIDGNSLAHWLSENRLTVVESIALVKKLAHALEHAHDAGVIHRDLKPGNIMLDHNGEPHIMDFGLAKRQVGEVTMTRDGQLIGTPAYMAPEQARGQAHASDAATDIYSLGVILYELLTSELPFRGNVQMMIQQVLNDEPLSPRKLNNSVPMDVETICLKCMEKEPSRRFQSANELSAELGRFLAHRPILTRRIGSLGKSWRWMKRNPAVAGLTAGIVLAIAVGIAATTYWIYQAFEFKNGVARGLEREASALKRDRVVYQHVINNLKEQLKKDRPTGIYKNFYDHALERTQNANSQQDAIKELLGFPEEMRDQRWELLHARMTSNHDERVVTIASGELLERAQVSHDGKRVAAKVGTSIKIFDANNANLIHTIEGVSNTEIEFLNGDQWIASYGTENTIELFSSESGEMIASIELADIVTAVAYAPNKNYLIVGSGDHMISFWSCDDFKRVATQDAFRHNYVSSLAITPNEFVLMSTGGKKISQWNLRDLRRVMAPIPRPHELINGCCAAPDNRRICTFCDKMIAIHFIPGSSGQERVTIESPFGAKQVKYSPDGKLLVATNSQNEIRILRADLTGKPDLLRTLETTVLDARFTTDGKEVVVVSQNGEVRFLRIAARN